MKRIYIAGKELYHKGENFNLAEYCRSDALPTNVVQIRVGNKSYTCISTLLQLLHNATLLERNYRQRKGKKSLCCTLTGLGVGAEQA